MLSTRKYLEKIRMIGIRFKLAYMAVAARLAKKRCLYIDCGSNLGQGYAFFSRYLRPSRYDAILVEPNPNCMEVLRTKYQARSHIEFMESAAWVKD